MLNANAKESRDGELDEEARPTWPSSPPEVPPPSSRRARETWEDCAALAERIVRLVGGDASRAIAWEPPTNRHQYHSAPPESNRGFAPARVPGESQRPAGAPDAFRDSLSRTEVRRGASSDSTTRWSINAS